MIKQILHDTLGVGDGEGSTSSTRVIRIVATAFWLFSKYYNAHYGHAAITWDENDLYIYGLIAGTGLVQTKLENPSKPVAQQPQRP